MQQAKIKVNLATLMGRKKIRSIRELSRKTGISRDVLGKLYKEELEFKPSFQTLITLCDVLECSLEELIEYDPRKQNAS